MSEVPLYVASRRERRGLAERGREGWREMERGRGRCYMNIRYAAEARLPPPRATAPVQALEFRVRGFTV